MTIRLANYSGEKNRINKDISFDKECTGTLREGADVTNPSILIESPVNEVCGFNYAYIPEFKRWYYITNCTSFRTGLTVVNMSVDVLYTYKETILTSTAIVTRSARSGDAKFSLPDDRFPVLQSETTHTITYDSLYDADASETNPKGQSMILILTGIDEST